MGPVAPLTPRGTEDVRDVADRLVALAGGPAAGRVPDLGGRSGPSAHPADAATNNASPAANTRRRPNLSPIAPAATLVADRTRRATRGRAAVRGRPSLIGWPRVGARRGRRVHPAPQRPLPRRNKHRAGLDFGGRRRSATGPSRSGPVEPNRRDPDHRLLTERGFRGHGYCHWRCLRRCHGVEEQRG